MLLFSHSNHNPVQPINEQNFEQQATRSFITTWCTLTSNAGLAAFLSVMATIATDRLTRIAYANVSPKNNKNACKCRTPNMLLAK